MLERITVYWNTYDVEDIRRYTTGGFHPISLGDVLAAESPPRKYRILHKLGIGSYSTVWLAETLHTPSKRSVALKVCVADANSQNDLNIFSRLPESPNVLRLLDSFSIQGPNGLHTVLVHDVLASPTTLMRSPTRSGHRELCLQIAQGLADLHKNGIAHGDLHLGNVGVALPTLNNHSIKDMLYYLGSPECIVVLPEEQPSDPQALPAYLVPAISIAEYLTEKDPTLHEASSLRGVIMDLGNALLVEEQSHPFSTAAAVRAPELVFEFFVHSVKSPSTRASDIWSFACTIYELVFEIQLFHYADPSDRLLGNMATLCGEIPSSWKNYWESRELLRNMPISDEVADAAWQYKLERLTTYEREGEKLTKADVSELFALIRFMLKIDPESRPSAEEVIRHPWFARGKVLAYSKSSGVI